MYSYNKSLLVLGLIWAAGRGFSEVVKIIEQELSEDEQNLYNRMKDAYKPIDENKNPEIRKNNDYV